MNQARLGALAWLYGVVLWLTWTPTGGEAGRVYLLPPAMGWIVILGNLVLFVPLALVLTAARRSPLEGGGRGPWPETIRVASVVAILSLLVELGQFRVPGRTVSPYDLLMNTAGAGAAAWVFAVTIRRPATRWIARVLPALACFGVFTGVLVFLAATGFTADRMLRLTDWDFRYSIVAGDEEGGQRTYPGVVDEARVCVGEGDGAVCAEPGAGPAAREALVEGALGGGGSVGLSARVEPVGVPETAARIVTFSADTRLRNATLYQEGSTLTLRLRTPLGGPNGTGMEFRLPEAVPEVGVHRVDARYRPGEVRIRAGSVSELEREEGEGVREGVFQWSLLSGWILFRADVRGRSGVEAAPLRFGRAVGGLALAIPLGLAAGIVATGAPGSAGVRRAAGGIGGALMAGGGLWAISGALGVPIWPGDLGLASLIGAAAGTLASLGRRPPAGTPPWSS